MGLWGVWAVAVAVGRRGSRGRLWRACSVWCVMRCGGNLLGRITGGGRCAVEGRDGRSAGDLLGVPFPGELW